MISKISLGLGALALMVPFFLPTRAVYAQVDLSTNVDETNTTAGLADEELPEVIGSIINAVLAVLGIVLLLLIIYAGFLWMTAGGDSENVGKAKTIMINATVGLIVLLAAYAIAAFVLDALSTAGLAT